MMLLQGTFYQILAQARGAKWPSPRLWVLAIPLKATAPLYRFQFKWDVINLKHSVIAACPAENSQGSLFFFVKAQLQKWEQIVEGNYFWSGFSWDKTMLTKRAACFICQWMQLFLKWKYKSCLVAVSKKWAIRWWRLQLQASLLTNNVWVLLTCCFLD